MVKSIYYTILLDKKNKWCFNVLALLKQLQEMKDTNKLDYTEEQANVVKK